jgi:hypothetical protein
MRRFPLGALLAGAALVAVGYGLHFAFLFWLGALFAVGFPLGWALWSGSVAKGRIVTSIDDKLPKDDPGSRHDSEK